MAKQEHIFEEVPIGRGAKIGAAVIGVLFIFIIWGLYSIGSNMGAADKEDEVVATETQESLADEVEETLKLNYGIDSYTEYLLSDDYPPESLIGYITGMEDVSKGVVRVLVQTDATEDEAKRLARNVITTAGFDIEELKWVIVRGVDGRDYQVSRNDIPALR